MRLNTGTWRGRIFLKYSSDFTESVVEQAVLAWLENLGYMIMSDPAIAPGELESERDDHGQVVLERRLMQESGRVSFGNASSRASGGLGGSVDARLSELQVLIQGVFDKHRLLDLIRHFIVFEDTGGGVPVKKMAGYQQYHAVNVAIAEAIRACVQPHDGSVSELAWKTGDAKERVSVLPAAQEHVLAQEDGKGRLVKTVTGLSKAFALVVPHGKALSIRYAVAFFLAVKSVLTKSSADYRCSPDEVDQIRQVVSEAVSSDEVIDIFLSAGLKKPDISILSDEFLADVRGMP